MVLDLVEIADVGGRTRRDTQPVEQQQANQGVIRWTGGLGVLEVPAKRTTLMRRATEAGERWSPSGTPAPR